ncbi:MAG: hypothetical protein WC824_12710 [Bacteroidota bacterium]|jgi:hypothetical protein
MRKLVILTDKQHSLLTDAIDDRCVDSDEMRDRLGSVRAKALFKGATNFDNADDIPDNSVVVILTKSEANAVRSRLVVSCDTVEGEFPGRYGTMQAKYFRNVVDKIDKARGERE